MNKNNKKIEFQFPTKFCRSIIGGFLIFIFAFYILCGVSSASEYMNVVFILADDFGWSDTTLFGTTKFYRTPNIERLAKRGMVFTHAYSASPLCSPTRSAILTGLSPARTGITTPGCHEPQVILEATLPKNAPAHNKVIMPISVTRLNTNYYTLAKTLKNAGYATGHFGKWHLGAEPYSALQHGFDVDIPHWHGPGPAGSYVAPWKFPNFKENFPGEHIEDRMASEAVKWMEKNKDRPFFLNYWAFSVHAPFDAKKSLIEKYRSRVDPNDPQRSPTYAAMIESFDDAVGKLLDAIDRLKIADRTIIIFTSDNGGNMYDKVDGTTPTSNHPLRGGKATMFEGGTRVPCVIVWPGITKPDTTNDVLVQSEDFYPTLLDGLGIKPAPDQRFDGISILPALKGNTLSREAIFQYFPHSPKVPDFLPPSVSVHTKDDWKLIRIFHDGENGAHRYLLFNLRDDIGEKHNLADQKPELVRELDALIEKFLADTKAVVPVPNPAYDPAKNRIESESRRTQEKRTESRRTANKPSVVGGYQISKDTQLEIGDGELRIKSNGNDPWISIRNLPSDIKGPFKVKLRLSSTGKGKGVVYYATKTNPNYHIECSVSFDIQHDGKFHDYEITLPVESISAIRIDPGNAPGDIIITGLALYDTHGTPAKTWLTPSATR
jgi:arylsulfatase A-like enzyme